MVNVINVQCGTKKGRKTERKNRIRHKINKEKRHRHQSWNAKKAKSEAKVKEQSWFYREVVMAF